MNDKDIKILENYIYNKKDTMKEQLVQAIENLLKENEKLKTMLKNRIKYTNELEQDLFENASNYVVPVAKIKEIIDKKCMALQHRTKFEQILESEFLRLKGELLEGK